MNAILHNEKFPQLRERMAGADYLVSNTETDEMLKIGDEHLEEGSGEDPKEIQGCRWDQKPDIQAPVRTGSTVSSA